MSMYPCAAWLSPKGELYDCYQAELDGSRLVHLDTAYDICDEYYPDEYYYNPQDFLDEHGWAKIESKRYMGTPMWYNCGVIFNKPLTNKQINKLIELERWDEECEKSQQTCIWIKQNEDSLAEKYGDWIRK